MSTSTLSDELSKARARRAWCTDCDLVVELKDGRRLSAPLSWFPRLAHGTPEERANIEVLPFSLHWEDLNEDLSIEGLLRGNKSFESPASIKRWLSYRARGEKEPIREHLLPPDIAKDLIKMGIWSEAKQRAAEKRVKKAAKQAKARKAS